jgi:hypothetical protein
MTIKAIYENGMFKPYPVHLDAHTEVEVSIPARVPLNAADPTSWKAAEALIGLLWMRRPTWRNTMTHIWALGGADGRAAYNGPWSDHDMRISTAREFRDTTGLLRSRTPILVTRRGRVAGIFFPRPELTLPIELKRELYNMLSSDVARQLKRRKVSEDEVLKDFEASRKKRRAARRRR